MAMVGSAEEQLFPVENTFINFSEPPEEDLGRFRSAPARLGPLIRDVDEGEDSDEDDENRCIDAFECIEADEAGALPPTPSSLGRASAMERWPSTNSVALGCQSRYDNAMWSSNESDRNTDGQCADFSPMPSTPSSSVGRYAREQVSFANVYENRVGGCLADVQDADDLAVPPMESLNRMVTAEHWPEPLASTDVCASAGQLNVQSLTSCAITNEKMLPPPPVAPPRVNMAVETITVQPPAYDISELPGEQDLRAQIQPFLENRHSVADDEQLATEAADDVLETKPRPPAAYNPHPLTRTVNDDGSITINWTLDQRKVEGKDTRAISYRFSLPLGELSHVPFTMKLEPKSCSLKKGSSSFKNCTHGIVKLKCEEAGEQTSALLKFQIALGAHDVAEWRGPVEHDFGLNGLVSGLHADEEQWELKPLVDTEARTLLIRLRVLP